MYFVKEEKTNYFEHAEKKDGSMNSTTSEKGTDGKPNNSSAYNHEYYMKNKEKWGVKYSEQTNGDSDFDDKNFTDENRLGDTDFYGIKGADGSWTVIEENMKWKLPAGVSKEDIVKAVGAVSAKDKESRMSAKDFEKAVSGALENMPGKGGKEFDVDAAAKDVIRGKYKNGAERKAALGEDYAVVQKRVNEMMKAKHSDEDGEVLEHHGIQGQKWGVRRFQNAAGRLTAAGKKRYSEKLESKNNGILKSKNVKSDGVPNTGGNRQGGIVSYNKTKHILDPVRPMSISGNSNNGGTKSIHIDKKKAAVVAGVAVGAALLAHPATRQVIVKYGKTAMKALPGVANKAGVAVGKAGFKAGQALGASGKRVGSAMLDAALMSVGAVEIAKLGKKLEVPDDADQATKDRNKVIYDTAKAGIEAATKASGSSSSSKSSGNGGGNVGKEVTDKLGAPSKKGVDKQSKEYQDLFRDVSPETRGNIKSLASQGYDIDQLKQYKSQFGHADLDEWIHASEFGSYIV